MAVDERSEVSFSRNVAVATVRRHCCYDVIAFRPDRYGRVFVCLSVTSQCSAETSTQRCGCRNRYRSNLLFMLLARSFTT